MTTTKTPEFKVGDVVESIGRPSFNFYRSTMTSAVKEAGLSLEEQQKILSRLVRNESIASKPLTRFRLIAKTDKCHFIAVILGGEEAGRYVELRVLGFYSDAPRFNLLGPDPDENF